MARHRSSSAAPSAALALALAQAQGRLADTTPVTTAPAALARVAAAAPAPVVTAPAAPVAPAPADLGDADVVAPEPRGLHRIPVPSAAKGRAAAAVVAAGALVVGVQAVGSDSPAGAATQEVALAAGSSPVAAAVPAAAAAPQVLTVAKAADPAAVTALAKGQRLGDDRAAREAAARAPLFVDPAQGTLTSGFGARWGAQHLGVDIANAIGTPIGSVAAGTVIEAGPASGFGLWVRVLHDDGTITVYGHVNEIIAPAGTRVAAGQEIATIGNRGQSTGPHLHFEVWANGKDKIDPLPWLAQRGIDLGPMMG